MSDWKEIEDVERPCGEDNGWCGWCGNCCDHAEYLRNTDEWGDES